MSKLVFLKDIDIKSSPMVRDNIRDDVVKEYAELYKEKEKMPPVNLFWSNSMKVHLVGDGMHRLNAMASLGMKTCVAMVIDGEFNDALKFALKANERHGLRRSNADKRVCVYAAIKQWPELSSNALASMCRVDNHTVATIRDEMIKDGKSEPVSVVKGSDGKKYPSRKKESKSEDVKRGGSCSVDRFKRPIPEAVRKYADRTDEVKTMINSISDIKQFLVSAQSQQDLMYCEVNFSSAIADLDKVSVNLWTAIPYAVCTECSGHPETKPGGCRLCRGRGLISRFRWNSVPAEIRNAIEASAKVGKS